MRTSERVVVAVSAVLMSSWLGCVEVKVEKPDAPVSTDASTRSSEGGTTPAAPDSSADGSIRLPDSGTPAPGDVVQPIEPAGVVDLDLLFMIDNSGSMATKQARLAAQLPRLLSVLTTGDRCASLPVGTTCQFSDTTTPKRLFTPLRSLHAGVVTSNAGGIDNPPGNQAAILSCSGNGDDGKLQDSTDIAINGVIAGSREFQGYNAGDVVIPPAPECANIGPQPLYQEYSVDAKNLVDIEKNFKCVSRVGVRGCPFEQQLESPWKALAPSTGVGDDYTFLNQARGEGDTYNQGFLRDRAVLAVLLVTDEDDCAIKDAGKVMFITGGAAGTAADMQYGALNLRCGLNYTNADLIQPTDRYVRGFRSLKPNNPERVVFAAITGVPQAAVRAGNTIDQILALPEMVFRENPASAGFPLPSCTNSANTESAYPPIRISQVVRDFGDQGILYSICEDDYAPAIDSLILKIAAQLRPSCLPQPLQTNADGLASCQLYELLAAGETQCTPARGHLGSPVSRQVQTNGGVRAQQACLMQQVQVLNGAPQAGVMGWYYDNQSASVKAECAVGQQQRISFTFGSLPAGAEITLDCP